MEENLCWNFPHIPPTTQSVIGLNWTNWNTSIGWRHFGCENWTCLAERTLLLTCPRLSCALLRAGDSSVSDHTSRVNRSARATPGITPVVKIPASCRESLPSMSWTSIQSLNFTFDSLSLLNLCKKCDALVINSTLYHPNPTRTFFLFFLFLLHVLPALRRRGSFESAYGFSGTLLVLFDTGKIHSTQRKICLR